MAIVGYRCLLLTFVGPELLMVPRYLTLVHSVKCVFVSGWMECPGERGMQRWQEGVENPASVNFPPTQLWPLAGLMNGLRGALPLPLVLNVAGLCPLCDPLFVGHNMG